MTETGNSLPLPEPPKITDKSKLPHNVNVARYWLRVMREKLKGRDETGEHHT